MQQYNDLIKIVESIEKDSSKVDLHNIDIAEISSRQIGHNKPLFKNLLPVAMEIEMSYMKAASSKTQQQSRQVVQAAPAKTQQQATITVQRYPPEQRLLPSQMIKDEIGAFAEKLHKSEANPKTFKMIVTGKNDLVLPKLSISDQISELEQIIEGLSENVFDKQHMQIIKKEIYGLTQEVEKEKRGRAYKAVSSSMEQSLVLLRDQRLNEARAMLRDMNV